MSSEAYPLQTWTHHNAHPRSCLLSSMTNHVFPDAQLASSFHQPVGGSSSYSTINSAPLTSVRFGSSHGAVAPPQPQLVRATLPSLFGNNQSSGTGGGLFAHKPFGSNSSGAATGRSQVPAGALFGASRAGLPSGGPPIGGLFGASTAGPPTGGLFGASTAGPPTGGLFGASTAGPPTGGPPTGYLFGSAGESQCTTSSASLPSQSIWHATRYNTTPTDTSASPFGVVANSDTIDLGFDVSSTALDNFDFDSFLEADGVAHMPLPDKEADSLLDNTNTPPGSLSADVAMRDTTPEFPEQETGFAPTRPRPPPQENTKASSLFPTGQVSFMGACRLGNGTPTQSGFGSTSVFGSPSVAPSAGTQSSGLFGNAAPSAASGPTGISMFGNPPAAPSTSTSPSTLFGSAGFGSAAPRHTSTQTMNPFGNTSPTTTNPFSNSPNPDQALTHLISLLTFQGSWLWTPSLFTLLRVSESAAEEERAKEGWGQEEWATALVIAFFEERLGKERGSWELVVEKARGWLAGRVGQEKVEGLVTRARGLV
jgi:hypothetical protein